MPGTRSTAAAPMCAAVLLLLASGAKADDAVNCEEALSTHEQNVCADRDFAKADAALNEVYQDILKSIPEMAGDPPYDAKSFEDAMRASQRAWVAYRDADCKGEIPMHWTGGTGTYVAVMGCMTVKTEARTQDLRERFDKE